MKARNLTTVMFAATFTLMVMAGSANRAEAHWGWGIGAGIAAALISGGIYRHHHRHYYGYPYYGYGYLSPLLCWVLLSATLALPSLSSPWSLSWPLVTRRWL